jgi:conjugal transfer pilin signal peptidase TrbI
VAALRRFLVQRGTECRALAAWIRRHWIACTVVFALYGIGQHGLFVNWSDSLPYHLVWLDYNAIPVQGDLVVYRFEGQPFQREELQGLRLFKRVAGMPGDSITVADRFVSVAGRSIGLAKKFTRHGEALTPVAAGRIPDGHLFAHSDSVDSFDSRYAECGLVSFDQLIGVAHVLF